MFVGEYKNRAYYKCKACGKPFSFKKNTMKQYYGSKEYCTTCLRNETPLKKT